MSHFLNLVNVVIRVARAVGRSVARVLCAARLRVRIARALLLIDLAEHRVHLLREGLGRVLDLLRVVGLANLLELGQLVFNGRLVLGAQLVAQLLELLYPPRRSCCPRG